MAASTNALNIISPDFSIEFFKNVTLSSRAKEKGYNFFINGYVYAVKIYSTTDKTEDSTAKCYRSMKKSEDPHKVNMAIDCNKCAIDDSHCSCQAGIPDVYPEDVKRLKADPQLPLSYLLQDDISLQQSICGNIREGSMLNYHFQHFKDHPNKVDVGKCGDTVFPKIVKNIAVIEKYGNIVEMFTTSLQDAEKIEKETVDQANCELWFKERRDRLTASQFGKICKRKKHVNEIFLRDIFSSSNKTFSTSVPSYGKGNESSAKSKYLESFQERHIHDCGLVINPDFPFLAATPDGKVCFEGKTGVLEIKCPFSARDLTIPEAVQQVSQFCLTQNADGYIELKRTQEYFFQVQGQMMVSGASFCEFVVYTKKDIFVQNIKEDLMFQNEMCQKLANFYLQHGADYVKSLRI